MATQCLFYKFRPAAILLFLGVLISSCSSQPTGASEQTRGNAAELHRGAIVVDTHADTLQRVLMYDLDLGKRLDSGHIDLPRLKEGGVDAEFFSVWLDSIYQGPPAIKRTLQLIDAMYQVIAKNPEQIQLAVNASDVERLHRQGKLSALMGIEGGQAV